jgi:hypothetical protein
MGMASELFLGPDGGPYVSVNENSGDIELKDNSGNVVAFWDESNTQWDFSSNDIQNVGSLGVESIGNERLYAGGFGGADPDDRLDNAIGAASAGYIIFLENDEYTADRTISEAVSLSGTKPARGQNTKIDANWILTSNVRLEHVTLNEQNSGEVLTVDGDSVNLFDVFGAGNATIQVNGDEILATHLERLAVNFDSATADGLVDSSILVTVNGNTTDNDVGTIT